MLQWFRNLKLWVDSNRQSVRFVVQHHGVMSCACSLMSVLAGVPTHELRSINRITSAMVLDMQPLDFADQYYLLIVPKIVNARAA